MLQSIRDNIQGWLAWVIIIFLTIPFALWGVNQYFDVVGENFIAKVGDVEIPVLEYREAYQSRYQQLQQLYGERFRPELIDESQLSEETIDLLVRTELLNQQVQREGYRIADEKIVEQIRDVPAFQANGEFSQEVYRVQLSYRGMTPTAFEERLRKALELDQLQDAIRRTEFVVPEQVADSVALREQRRQFSNLSVPVSRFLDDVVVDDAEISAYYEENPSLFMTEEKVTLQYIELTAADFDTDIEMTEELLRERYQQEADQYLDQEQRLARHILFTADDEDAEAEALSAAAEVVQKLAAGADFAELAGEYSQDGGSAAEGGSLGWITRGMLVGPFEEELFAMQEGDVSEPVKTDFGYHIIRLDQIKAPQPRPFEDIRDQLADTLRAEMTEQRFYDRATELADLAFANPDSLELASNTLEMEIHTIPDVTRLFGSGIATNPAVRQAVFDETLLAEGLNSDLIEIGENHVAVVRAAEHILPQQKALDEVREEIGDRLEREAAETKAQELADSIADRARVGESLEELAGEFELPFTASRPATRNESGIPFDLLREVFKAKSPADGISTVEVVNVGANEFAVFQLDTVTKGEVGNLTEAERDARTRDLSRRAAVDQIPVIDMLNMPFKSLVDLFPACEIGFFKLH
ncbi:MAG: SurA N-terminal domain-containing protein [Gammaproteobacteria bacterium]|nr:SurA N-terminal domain-containing protein [Gammaproteobacteria bacterium]